MKTYTHTAATWFFIYDIKTKAVVIAPRPCVEGVTTKYDDLRVEMVTANSIEALNEMIAAKTY